MAMQYILDDADVLVMRLELAAMRRQLHKLWTAIERTPGRKRVLKEAAAVIEARLMEIRAMLET